MELTNILMRNKSLEVKLIRFCEIGYFAQKSMTSFIVHITLYNHVLVFDREKSYWYTGGEIWYHLRYWQYS